MPNLIHKFQVLLDDPLKDALIETSKRTGISRGLVIRYAIAYYHAMVVAGIPTCANGQRCYCPQLHQQVGTPLAPPLVQAQSHPPTYPEKPAPVKVDLPVPTEQAQAHLVAASPAPNAHANILDPNAT